MATLGTGGGTGYESEIDTYVDETDAPKTGKTELRADIVNDLYAAVTGIQTVLGTSISGSKSDLKTRLAVSIGDDGKLQDGIAVVGSSEFTTIQDAIDGLPT